MRRKKRQYRAIRLQSDSVIKVRLSEEEQQLVDELIEQEPGLNTPAEALLWSLRRATEHLRARRRSVHGRERDRDRSPSDSLSAPSSGSPFDWPGIGPDPAPSAGKVRDSG
jgi:hypothetical protein